MATTQFLMRSIAYDTVLLNTELSYEVFTDRDDKMGERVVKQLEAATVKWFFQHPCNFPEYLFFKELGITDHQVFLEVGRPVIIDDDKPGDIDILLVNPKAPDKAIGIQVKRITCTIDEFNQPK